MSRAQIERRLSEVGKRLKTARVDFAVAKEALSQVEFEADDARLRSLVSETPVAQREYEEIRRQAEVQRRNHDALQQEIAELEERQDALLDEYNNS